MSIEKCNTLRNLPKLSESDLEKLFEKFNKHLRKNIVTSLNSHELQYLDNSIDLMNSLIKSLNPNYEIDKEMFKHLVQRLYVREINATYGGGDVDENDKKVVRTSYFDMILIFNLLSSIVLLYLAYSSIHSVYGHYVDKIIDEVTNNDHRIILQEMRQLSFIKYVWKSITCVDTTQEISHTNLLIRYASQSVHNTFVKNTKQIKDICYIPMDIVSNESFGGWGSFINLAADSLASIYTYDLTAKCGVEQGLKAVQVVIDMEKDKIRNQADKVIRLFWIGGGMGYTACVHLFGKLVYSLYYFGTSTYRKITNKGGRKTKRKNKLKKKRKSRKNKKIKNKKKTRK